MASGDPVAAAAPAPPPDDPTVFAVVDGFDPPLWGTRGLYFTPTDSDMIGFLADKLRQLPVPRLSADLNATIHNAQVYGIPPEQLLNQYAPVNGLWYFFTKRIRKYPNGSRPCRSVGQKGTGFWKATGAEKSIKNSQGLVMGKKQSLVFYWGEQNGGKGKSNWIMHEYTLSTGIIVAPSNKPLHPFDLPVLCKIYKKTQGTNQQAEENQSDRFGVHAEEISEVAESEDAAAAVPIKKRQRSGRRKKHEYTGASTSTSFNNEEAKTEQQNLETSGHVDLAAEEHAFAANDNYQGDLPQQQLIAQNNGYVDYGNYNHYLDLYDQQTQFNTYDHTTEHVDWNYDHQVMNMGYVGAPPNQVPSYEQQQQDHQLGAPGNVIECSNYLLQEQLQYNQEVPLATCSTSGHPTAQMQTTNATDFAIPKMPLLVEPEDQCNRSTRMINNNTINMDQKIFSEKYISFQPGAYHGQESNINDNMIFHVNHQNPAPVVDPTYEVHATPHAGGDIAPHDQAISTAPVAPPFLPETIKAGADGGLGTVVGALNIADTEARWPYDCDDYINIYLHDFEDRGHNLKDVGQEDYLKALESVKFV